MLYIKLSQLDCLYKRRKKNGFICSSPCIFLDLQQSEDVYGSVI